MIARRCHVNPPDVRARSTTIPASCTRLCPLQCDRQHHLDPRPLPEHTLQIDLPTMCLDNRPRNTESEPRATTGAGTTGINPIKPVKDARLMLRRNPCSV